MYIYELFMTNNNHEVNVTFFNLDYNYVNISDYYYYCYCIIVISIIISSSSLFGIALIN